MNVHYQHANPRSGNESFLLRFESDGNQSQTACILVDAGENVDVDELLADDEYLTAIVLTHAHSDHYQSLATNLRDGAPIYTSEATGRILETVLTEAQQYRDGSVDTEPALDALEPLDGWESPVKGLRLAPIPAGHVPGATGFVFQFEADDEWKTILATGDWTWQRAAGYPGFDTFLPTEVGAVFLTAATSSKYEAELTESVGTICERATAGSPVLVSASGLMGVKYAYLIGHLAHTLSQPISVTVAGQVAKLYEDLNYDVPNVRTAAEFDDPGDLLAPEMVTIAGPEVPTAGSSARLFGQMRNDPNATLVQIVAGGGALSPTARCTTHDFEVVPHPTESDLDTLVGDLAPTQVVITHQHGRIGGRYKERYQSYVWATADQSEYTIHADDEWTAPPWMTSEGRSYVEKMQNSSSDIWLGETFAGADEELPLPACNRINEDADLAEEGLDMDALEQRLRSPEPTGATSEETTATGGPPASSQTPSTGSVSQADIGAITSRLDSIESQLGGTAYPARVIDAGEDMTLLRALGDLDYEHGQTIEIVVRDNDGTTE